MYYSTCNKLYLFHVFYFMINEKGYIFDWELVEWALINICRDLSAVTTYMYWNFLSLFSYNASFECMKMGLSDIFRRYTVLIVCVPSLALLHFGWYQLQFNKAFVPQDQKHIRIGTFEIERKPAQENPK